MYGIKVNKMKHIELFFLSLPAITSMNSADHVLFRTLVFSDRPNFLVVNVLGKLRGNRKRASVSASALFACLFGNQWQMSLPTIESNPK